MSYDDYWHGSPELCTYYRRAYNIKKESKNQQLWLQGLYIYKAVAAVMSGMFSTNSEGYLSEPIRITPLTEREKEERAEKSRQELINRLSAWEATWKSSKE